MKYLYSVTTLANFHVPKVNEHQVLKQNSRKYLLKREKTDYNPGELKVDKDDPYDDDYGRFYETRAEAVEICKGLIKEKIDAQKRETARFEDAIRKLEHGEAGSAAG